MLQLTVNQRSLVHELLQKHSLSSTMLSSSEKRSMNQLVKQNKVIRGTADEGDARSKVYYLEYDFKKELENEVHP